MLVVKILVIAWAVFVLYALVYLIVVEFRERKRERLRTK